MGVGWGYPAVTRIEDFRVKIKISYFLLVGPLGKIASSPLSMIIRITHHFIAKNKKREVILKTNMDGSRRQSKERINVKN